jgi:hypothetical protein
MMEHSHISAINRKARSMADKSALGIDGQYKPLLSVIGQTKHGLPKREDSSECITDEEDDQVPIVDRSEIKVLLTVSCIDGILLTKPMFSEGFDHQVECLAEAVAVDAQDVKIIFSDAPSTVDKRPIYHIFINLKCVCKDVLHIVLKIEQAFGEKICPLTSTLRKCLRKFKYYSDDGKRYFVAGLQPLSYVSLVNAIAAMKPVRAKTLVKRMDSVTYQQRPYPHMDDFVRDVAALTIVFHKDMARKVAKGTTVKQSLIHATSPLNLEYLANIGRFGSRNPSVQLLTGTTHNEAYHLELKSFFRNVMHQTKEHAQLICKVATLSKLIALVMSKAELSVEMRQADSIKNFIQALRANVMRFSV